MNVKKVPYKVRKYEHSMVYPKNSSMDFTFEQNLDINGLNFFWKFAEKWRHDDVSVTSHGNFIKIDDIGHD